MKTYFAIAVLFALFTSSPACYTTLYANDPLLDSIVIADGTPAKTYKGYYTQERSVDIIYGEMVPGELTLAPFSKRMAGMVDLGTEANLKAKYLVKAPLDSMFFSIHYDDGKLWLAKDARNGTFQPFDRSDLALLQIVTPAPSFKPIVNHIYLMNITDDKLHTQQVAKMMVTSITNDQIIRFRWNVLLDHVNGHDIYCFTHADQPTHTDDNGGNTPVDRGYPSWVKGSGIALFVLTGMLVLMVIALMILYNRVRHLDYQTI